MSSADSSDSGDRMATEAGPNSSNASNSYRIRLRKLDNQTVLMGGLLPADSTLRTLAQEIVKAGHAESGKFSFVIPQIQNRPSAVYDPAAFDTSLECCGVFGNHMTITLQKFLPPAPSNWSPPPPLVRGICPRGRIDAQKENLEILHQQFPWIPGQEAIRPTRTQIEAKHASQREIETLYEAYLDFVLIEIFGFPIVGGVSENPKRKADFSNDAAIPLTVFKHNKFPYAVPAGTNHYVWWTREPMFQTPDRVTKCIEAALQELQSGAVHNIVWYENPKMTIPEVYHVQVFWSRVE